MEQVTASVVVHTNSSAFIPWVLQAEVGLLSAGLHSELSRGGAVPDSTNSDSPRHPWLLDTPLQSQGHITSFSSDCFKSLSALKRSLVITFRAQES